MPPKRDRREVVLGCLVCILMGWALFRMLVCQGQGFFGSVRSVLLEHLTGTSFFKERFVRCQRVLCLFFCSQNFLFPSFCFEHHVCPEFFRCVLILFLLVSFWSRLLGLRRVFCVLCFVLCVSPFSRCLIFPGIVCLGLSCSIFSLFYVFPVRFFVRVLVFPWFVFVFPCSQQPFG